MNSIENILKGKQIGYREDREKDNIKVYYAIAVQKWEGKFKIFIREIEQDKLDMFAYEEDLEDEIEKIIQLDTIEEVLNYFNEVLHMDIELLHPLKGQKIFDPSW